MFIYVRTYIYNNYRKNSGGGLSVLNVMSVLVENCVFEDNTGRRPDFQEDSVSNFRTHNSGGLALLYSNISHAEAAISNCTFRNNKASRHPNNTNDSRPHTYVPYGHGGALIVRFSTDVNDVTVDLSNCIFMENYAFFGGGAISIISLISSPSDNRIFIRNSTFNSSKADHTGGAISIRVINISWSVIIVDIIIFSMYGVGGVCLKSILSLHNARCLVQKETMPLQ